MLWNFVLRLIMEESLETLYSVALTFKYSQFNTNAFGSVIDYILSIILTFAILCLPFFMIIFYLKYYAEWGSEEFDNKYGAPLDGLKKNQKSSLVYPVYFIIRRSMFCVVTLVLFDYVILQLLCHFILTLISITYLITFVPQQNPLEYRLELMNEVFTLIIIDLCFLFTELDSDQTRQYNWGYVFIVVIFSCVGIHVLFLLKHIIRDLILKFRTARKIGFKQSFLNLINGQRILQVLAFRRRRLSNILNDIKSQKEK
jgi:hypothetical protein